MTACSKLTFTAAGALGLALGAGIAHAGDRALIVGIDDYSALGPGQMLGSAVADAKRFRDYLVDHQGLSETDITLLADARASSKAIMDVIIDRLIGETAADDRVYFYFAGLGSRVEDTSGREPDGQTEVILAHDADSFLGKMPEDAFAEMFDLIADRDVTVFIDASFQGNPAFDLKSGEDVRLRGAGLSATLDEDRGELSDVVKVSSPESFTEAPFAAGEATRNIWVAAAPSQYAWEDGPSGVFTDAFLNAVENGGADMNANGAISNAEILTITTAALSTWCADSADCAAAGAGLVPHFVGDLEHVFAQADVLTVPEVLPGADKSPKKPLSDGTAQARLPVDPHAAMLGFVSDLFAPNNTVGLSLSSSTGQTMQLGQFVEFDIRANRPGTLVLLDINPKDELDQVFPSELAEPGSTALEAGKTLKIPNGTGPSGLPLRIRVTEPAGKGFLLAILVEDDLPALEAVLPENIKGGPVPNARAYLVDIAQDLLTLQAGENGNRAVRWSAVYLPYEIVP